MITKKKKPKRIVAKHERIVNNAARRFTDADWPVGSAGHQGDVILVRIAILPPTSKPRKNRQVAEGNTQGSRHLLQGGEIFDCEPAKVVDAIKAACPRSTIEAKYVGPVFLADGNTVLTHPEHGHHIFEKGMVIAVAFQRSWDAELKEEKRVRD